MNLPHFKCKTCTERYVGCHSKCDSYKEARECQDEVNKVRNEYNEGRSRNYQNTKLKYRNDCI